MPYRHTPLSARRLCAHCEQYDSIKRTVSSNYRADDVFSRLDRDKRSLIRHVAFESQWGLQLSLNSDMSGKIDTQFNVEWGNYITSALDDLPNIKSITLRVRCTTHYTEILERWGAFEWDRGASTIRPA